MNLTKKNIVLVQLLCIFFYSATLKCDEVVTITAPADAATVSASPLSITGTSSQPNFRVRLTINTTEIGSATTNGSGDWDFTLQSLSDGDYILTAALMSDTFETLATDANSFTVQNPETIIITSPRDDETVFFNPAPAAGRASLASTTVDLSVDGVLAASTTTDTQGDWQTAYAIPSDGAHTLLAELKVGGVAVASTSIDISAKVPIILPVTTSQIQVVAGEIPTTGSGSGSGFTYSVSGSVITIDFVPDFSLSPVIIATGKFSAGSSTVTVSAVTASSADITFSAGTETVHFIAITLA